MTGLIEEIQRDALDSKVPIEALLRRVKFAAAKLSLDTLGTWVEQELNGYSLDLPEYRKLRGQVAAWNPYHGWQPVQFADHEIAEIVSQARVGQSISSLRDLVERGGDGLLHFTIPPALLSRLNEMMNYPAARVVVQMSRGQVISILDHVRNMVLDWAIEMERRGIVGEGLSFSAHERKDAQQAMTNLNIGSIGSFVGNMGSGNASRDITASGFSISHVTEVAGKIKEAIPELVRAGIDPKFLEQKLEAIETEASSSTPDHGKLGGLLTDIRNALSGAAGNLTAAGALAGIDAVLRALGMG